MINQRKRIIISVILLFFASFLYSQSETKEESEIQIPVENQIDYSNVFSDLRRFEIISFGSMPFITLDTTLVYSFYKFFANDFDTSSFNIFSSKNYTQSEINGILITSATISVCIAITDYIINLVKRNKSKKYLQNTINIYPLEFPDESEVSAQNSPEEGVN